MLCVLSTAEPEKWNGPSPLEARRSCAPDLGHRFLHSWILVWLWSDCNCALGLFPLGSRKSRKYVTCFGFYRSPQLKDLGYFKETELLKCCWNFSRVWDFYKLEHVVIFEISRRPREWTREEQSWFSSSAFVWQVDKRPLSLELGSRSSELNVSIAFSGNLRYTPLQQWWSPDSIKWAANQACSLQIIRPLQEATGCLFLRDFQSPFPKKVHSLW